jgi:hypothetical protein
VTVCNIQQQKCLPTCRQVRPVNTAWGQNSKGRAGPAAAHRGQVHFYAIGAHVLVQGSIIGAVELRQHQSRPYSQSGRQVV